MASSSGEVVIVPRNFMLLEELEKAEKGNTDMSISYGLVHSDDISLTHWQCTILGANNSPVEGRILSLLLTCGAEYPSVIPKVTFQSKVNYPFVNSNGEVNFGKYPGGCGAWASKPGRKPDRTIEMVLKDLKSTMTKPEYRKLAQPADGSTY
eukprot:CAMPEP_0174754430 /NCGR_PEP_ID=MMETSP1094-20130205/105730_1 /TAXON_ID=156173 /ORGANISM="Chrysochromulina brevifilum, Strain UTEX LB 985" /LENGTH=151 /DNA_ID=CAMNT_0015960297 /DNA_START=48 /DNA_END=503 /DNA_ORIENTATION=+